MDNISANEKKDSANKTPKKKTSTNKTYQNKHAVQAEHTKKSK